MNVLVTGASRGLGAAIARSLARRGHRLFLAARSDDDLRTLAVALERDHGARVGWLQADLRDPHACEALAAAAEAHFGGVDVLVNNAGIGPYKPVVEWSAEEIQGVVALNLLAPMQLARRVLPGMLQRGHGYIVDIASDLAQRPLANMAPYVATKSGLLGFGRSLHREVRDRGVRLTTVMPGIIDSAFNGAREGSKDPRWALPPADIAERVADLLELPANVVIDELTIHPAIGDY